MLAGLERPIRLRELVDRARLPLAQLPEALRWVPRELRCRRLEMRETTVLVEGCSPQLRCCTCDEAAGEESRRGCGPFPLCATEQPEGHVSYRMPSDGASANLSASPRGALRSRRGG